MSAAAPKATRSKAPPLLNDSRRSARGSSTPSAPRTLTVSTRTGGPSTIRKVTETVRLERLTTVSTRAS